MLAVRYPSYSMYLAGTHIKVAMIAAEMQLTGKTFRSVQATELRVGVSGEGSLSMLLWYLVVSICVSGHLLNLSKLDICRQTCSPS